MFIDFLYIIIPILVTPLLTFITWYISYKIEDKFSLFKSEKLLIKEKLNNFYWPMHIYLSRYNKILHRYNNIKSGNLSLSSSSSNIHNSTISNGIDIDKLNNLMEEYITILIDTLNKIKAIYEEQLPSNLDIKLLDAIIKLDDYIEYINICKKINMLSDEQLNNSTAFVILSDLISSQIS